MHSTTRRLATAAGVATLATFGVALAPAQACACADEGLATMVSDRTPASGEQFKVLGVWIDGGEPAVGRTVKIQAHRDGDWVNLTGAHATTDSDGEFALRVELSQTGRRVLRAVGVKPGPKPNVHDRFAVTAH